MSAITPQTELKLLKCPIESDNHNQMTFASKSAQTSYFNSLPKLTVDNFTYQRKDNVIRYPAHIDSILTYNYVMYQNEAYTNKWFYAFITKMEYVNDNMTYITIKTDVYQTWQFDIVWKRSFIEREHVNVDTIGRHTVPENLEIGEYICEANQDANPGNSHLVIAATYDCFKNVNAGSYVNGIYSGVDYYLIAPKALDPTLQSDPDAISTFLKIYATATKSEAITGMFIVPDKITKFANAGSYTWDYMLTEGGLSYYPYKKLTNLDLTGADFGDISITKPYSSVGSYVPKNNKLYTYPYKYLKATNNTGSSAIYHYEEFSSSTFKFKTKGSITPGCSIKCYPLNYKGITNNYDEGINYGKFPVCSFNTDMYTNWLTQNSVNIALNLVSGAGQIVGGAGVAVATGGAGIAVGAGSMVGGAATIANTLAQVYEHSLIPPQAEGNLNNGDINFSMGINKIMFYKMTIKEEYAMIIDQYFSAYGYKINQYGMPHITGRANWNYVKTINANIEGDIPEEDINEIKSIFNNGVTLWHNASTYLDYSQDNSIV